MMNLLGSPSLDFMYIRASAPDAPPLSETTIGCFIKLFFWIAACIIRAIWSEAPPAPAATTISTGLVGSQPAIAGALASMAVTAAAVVMNLRTRFFPLFWVDAGLKDQTFRQLPFARLEHPTLSERAKLRSMTFA